VTIDIVGDLIVAVAAVFLSMAWAFTIGRKRRGRPEDALPSLPHTTATNPIVLAETHPMGDHELASIARSQRWQQLVQSGALTQAEYTVLTTTLTFPTDESVRLSILRSGSNKIQDIKVIRTLFKLSLRDAKDIVDNLPQTFVTPMAYAEAQDIAQRLQATGMTTHIT